MGRLKIKDHKEYLPHRPPFCWVDEIVDWEVLSDGGVKGHCRLQLKKGAHYFNESGAFRPTAFFELMGQAHCFLSVALNGGRLLSKIYLRGLQNGKVYESMKLRGGETLDIFTLSEKSLRELSSFKGEVKLNDQPLAEAQVTAYYKF